VPSAAYFFGSLAGGRARFDFWNFDRFGGNLVRALGVGRLDSAAAEVANGNDTPP